MMLFSVRVDEVEIAHVGGGRLVGHVHRVLQRQVPDGEGLELGVTRSLSRLVVVVELGQAGGQLAAARTGAGDHHQWLFGLDLFVGPVPLVADDGLHIGGVTPGEAVGIDLDPSPLQLVLEDQCRRLVVEAGDHYAQNVDPPAPQVVDQFQCIGVIGNAEVGADLFAFDGAGVNAENQVGVVFQLLQQAHFHVGVVAGEYSRRVVVKEQLAAEFKVEFVVETLDPLHDFRGLLFQILLVVKGDYRLHRYPLYPKAGSKILQLQNFTARKSQDHRAESSCCETDTRVVTGAAGPGRTGRYRI